jgi:tRNA-specific 2-thiouridylase
MKRLEGRRARVVVAMSGGVDSSTVAGLLAEAGHQVIGISMKLHDADPTRPGSEGTCCSFDDVADARRVADHLGIPFYVSDLRKAFEKAVMDPFVEAYLAGRTPNPCVRCNDVVKFGALLAKAKALGADYLATGHYARTEVDEAGRVTLWEGKDPDKDQSYFLAGIAEGALGRVVFPLGGMTKQAVRGHARRLGLPVADKPESQDICFVPGGDYAAVVRERRPDGMPGAGLAAQPAAGPILSIAGLRLGTHRGLLHYTVGQRRGLGLPGPEPSYVVALRRGENALVVGRAADVEAGGLWASGENWLGPAPAPGTRVRAKIRHRHGGVIGLVRRGAGERFELSFDSPARAVAPGQQLAVYSLEGRVWGAATIEGAL